MDGFYRLLAALRRAAARQRQREWYSRATRSLICALRVNKISAAGSIAPVMARSGRREAFKYRALWTSELYGDLCIMASLNVPNNIVVAASATRSSAWLDAEGCKVLEAGAELLEEHGASWPVAVEDRDCDNYRRFYRPPRSSRPGAPSSGGLQHERQNARPALLEGLGIVSRLMCSRGHLIVAGGGADLPAHGRRRRASGRA